MGIDFIRRFAGKSFEKSWRDGLNRLKEPDLFVLSIPASRRIVTAALEKNTVVTAGAKLVVEMENDALLLIDGMRCVGRIESAPQAVKDAVRNAAGVALGTIERVGIFGDTAEVCIE